VATDCKPLKSDYGVNYKKRPYISSFKTSVAGKGVMMAWELREKQHSRKVLQKINCRVWSFHIETEG
jgi:hypothetical protein